MSKEALFNQNPWWQDKNAINNDFKIKELEAQQYQHQPSLIDEFDLSKPAILTLRGPRQIGKSTSLKILIRRLLQEDNINPWQVMFYSCDDLEHYKELIALLESYEEIRSVSQADSECMNYIFLDEISFIKDWQRALKSLYEQGKLTNTFIILSGSNAYDLHHQAERLPGRRGNDPNPDKVMLPLNFREFIELVSSDIKLPQFSLDEVLTEIKLLEELKQYELYSKQLRDLWNIYRLTGGFLKSINDYYVNKNISQSIYETYLQWIKGDISKLQRSEKIARQILYDLVYRTSSRLGWTDIAEKVDDIGHHSSIANYIEILESFFIAKTIYQIDIQKKTPNIKKQKKVFLLDNFIFWCVWAWNEKWINNFSMSREKSLAIEDKLVEMFIAQELFHLDKRDYMNSRIFFWSGTKEIDFVVFNNEGDLVPIEVKYQNQVDKKDFIAINKNFKSGIIVSKKQFENFDDQFFIVPYYLFGLL